MPSPSRKLHPSHKRKGRFLCLALVCLIAVTATGNACDGDDRQAVSRVAPKGLSIEQVQEGLRIARSAIADTDDFSAAERDQLHQVSANALARSLQFGPPSRSEKDDSAPLLPTAVVVDITRTGPSELSAFRNRLPSTLLNLSSEWHRQRVRPKLAFDALQTCVNPPARPDRLFLYPLESYGNGFPVPFDVRSIAHELIDWAVQAEKLESLRTSLTGQQLDAVAEGSFLLLLIALEQRDENAIAEHCQTLNKFAERATDPALARLLAATLMKASPKVLQNDDASRLLLQTSKTLLSLEKQSEQQRSFAATAVVAGIRAQLSIALKRSPEDLPDVARDASQLMISGLIGDDSPAKEFRWALADELILAGLETSAMPSATAEIVDERLRRFRRAGDTRREPSIGSSSADEIEIHWQQSETPADAVTCWKAMPEVLTKKPAYWFSISGLVDVAGPSVSRDGSIVAFHGRRPSASRRTGNHIFVIDVEQQLIHDLGPGVNPSLSPTGRRLTCSRFPPERGIWLMRSDGSNQQKISTTGWASRFSPDGTLIAWTLQRQEATWLEIFDLAADRGLSAPEQPDVLISRKTDSSETGWPFCWSNTDDADSTGSNRLWYRAEGGLKGLPRIREVPRSSQSLLERPVAFPVRRDLHWLPPNDFLALGPISGSDSGLTLRTTQDENVWAMGKQKVLGVCASDDAIVLFTREEVK